MTRSVAEIIKFSAPHEFHRHECVWCDSYEGTETHPLCWDNPTAPTADDLLAWLREQSVALQPQRDGDLYDLCVMPVALYVITREEWTKVEAPTILAALEAAVRAVAGES